MFVAVRFGRYVVLLAVGLERSGRFWRLLLRGRDLDSTHPPTHTPLEWKSHKLPAGFVNAIHVALSRSFEESQSIAPAEELTHKCSTEEA